MVAILLALASSLGYGGADFAGGLASRDAHVFRVVAAAAPAGLLVNLFLLPVLGLFSHEVGDTRGARHQLG